jgi:signal transduction histidine kinase
MVLIIFLIIATISQIVGAVVAIRLVRRTKFNLSWVLIAIAIVLMAVQNVIRFVPHIWRELSYNVEMLINWLSIVAAIFIVCGVFLISKIFDYLQQVEKERKESEEKMLAAIIQAEEKERRRLAKELHDGLGPLLSTVRMSISALRKHNNENEQAIKIVDNTEQIIKEAIMTVREISNNLSPHVLDNFGLIDAIKTFCTPINSLGEISVSFKTNVQGERFGEQTENILFRVFCEFLNNAIKHSKAKNVEVELMKHNNVLRLLISDDGKGFNVSKMLNNSEKMGFGMGLSNIYSRVKAIGGTVNIESSKKTGTDAIIVINL